MKKFIFTMEPIVLVTLFFLHAFSKDDDPKEDVRVPEGQYPSFLKSCFTTIREVGKDHKDLLVEVLTFYKEKISEFPASVGLKDKVSICYPIPSDFPGKKRRAFARLVSFLVKLYLTPGTETVGLFFFRKQLDEGRGNIAWTHESCPFLGEEHCFDEYCDCNDCQQLYCTSSKCGFFDLDDVPPITGSSFEHTPIGELSFVAVTLCPKDWSFIEGWRYPDLEYFDYWGKTFSFEFVNACVNGVDIKFHTRNDITPNNKHHIICPEGLAAKITTALQTNIFVDYTLDEGSCACACACTGAGAGAGAGGH